MKVQNWMTQGDEVLSKKRTKFSELLRFLPCKNVRTEDSWMCVVVSRCKEPLSEEGGTLSVKDEGLR